MTSINTHDRLVIRGTRLYAEGSIIDCVATMQVSNQPGWLEDAERLVACWNACNGITTENLQQNLPVKMLAESYNAAIAHLHALLNQRLTATQMQAAEAAAREWLAGIGSEAP